MNKFIRTCRFAAVLIFEIGSLHATNPEPFSSNCIKTYMETAAKPPHNHFLSSYKISPFPSEQIQIFNQYFPYFCDSDWFAKILNFYKISTDPFWKELHQISKDAHALLQQVQKQKNEIKKAVIVQLDRKKQINKDISLITPLCVQPACFEKNSIVSHSIICRLEKLQSCITCIRPNMRELLDIFQNPNLKTRAQKIFEFDKRLEENLKNLLDKNVQCIQLICNEIEEKDVAIICVLKNPIPTIHYQSQLLAKCNEKTIHDAEMKPDNALIIRSKYPYGGVSAYFASIPDHFFE